MPAMSSKKLLLFSLLISFALTTLMLSGCMPSSTSGNVYSRDQARTSHSVYYGTILRVEDVTIEGTQTGAGTVAGGVMGGVLGSSVGSGSGRGIATAGGAILGSLTGSAIEKGATTVAGLEMEVELDNGELILVVQEKDGVYRVGDRVRVIQDARGATRIRQ
jgi:outer membrane lipoprotein SlyB